MFEQFDHQKELLDKPEEKPLDELQSAILETVSDCMLTNEEVAALLISVMRNLISQPHNFATLKKLGKNNLKRRGINLDKLSAQACGSIQVMWAQEYARKLSHDKGIS